MRSTKYFGEIEGCGAGSARVCVYFTLESENMHVRGRFRRGCTAVFSCAAALIKMPVPCPPF